jgi:L-ascorbate metabolism protein UlaG (beta-lactamase superfamily)
MNLRFLGHATFYITTANGTRIVTDPYEPGGFGGAIGHGPIPDPADVITISHQHADHNDVKSVPGSPIVLSSVGEYTEKGVTFRGLATFHDAKRGAERGGNIVWSIEADGLRLCHLGDLGATLAAEEVGHLGPIDVLLIPVGGTFTLDARGATEVMNALKPRLALPMHYRTPKVKLNIAYVDDFLADKRNVERVKGSDLTVTTGTLPKTTEIIVLEPAL